MTYVIALPCVDVKDKACIDECPVDCIYEGERSLYIHPDECVDCGACEPVCPVEAIYYEDDVPDKWAEFYTANVEFFSEIGSPGGAAKMGLIEHDHDHRKHEPNERAALRLHQNQRRFSPGPSMLATQRPQISGCAGSTPTSAR